MPGAELECLPFGSANRIQFTALGNAHRIFPLVQ